MKIETTDRLKRIQALTEEINTLQKLEREEGAIGQVERALEGMALGAMKCKVNTIQDFMCDGQVDLEVESMAAAFDMTDKFDKVPIARVKDGWLAFVPEGLAKDGQEETPIEPVFLQVVPWAHTDTEAFLTYYASIAGYVMKVEVMFPPNSECRITYKKSYSQFDGSAIVHDETLHKPDMFTKVDKYYSGSIGPHRHVCWTPRKEVRDE